LIFIRNILEIKIIEEILKLIQSGNVISSDQKKEIESFCKYLRENDKDFNILFFGNTHARITTDTKHFEEFRKIYHET